MSIIHQVFLVPKNDLHCSAGRFLVPQLATPLLEEFLDHCPGSPTHWDHVQILVETPAVFWTRSCVRTHFKSWSTNRPFENPTGGEQKHQGRQLYWSSSYKDDRKKTWSNDPSTKSYNIVADSSKFFLSGAWKSLFDCALCKPIFFSHAALGAMQTTNDKMQPSKQSWFEINITWGWYRMM